jgi:hypothetical protein
MTVPTGNIAELPPDLYPHLNRKNEDPSDVGCKLTKCQICKLGSCPTKFEAIY